jgi:N-acyl homoserine lactone hydrolase
MKIFAIAFAALCLFGSISVSASDATPPADEIRVYALDCGRMEINDMAMFSDTGEYDGKPGVIRDGCYLIHHPKGWLLWDTGLGDKLVGHPLTIPFGKMSVDQSIVSQLAALNLKPADIQFIALSHVHSDHTGNANLFTSSTWLLQKKELDYALRKPAPMGVDASTLSNYKKVKTELLEGDKDVFGDGKVKILSTPGHTPGHQSLIVHLAKSGALVLSGDLYHQRENREFRRVPVMNFSRAETLASMDRIETIVKNEHAKIVVQHDTREAKDFPAFPDFLN